jgi:hypothetical protein
MRNSCNSWKGMKICIMDILIFLPSWNVIFGPRHVKFLLRHSFAKCFEASTIFRANALDLLGG